HTISYGDWSSDVCSSDLEVSTGGEGVPYCAACAPQASGKAGRICGRLRGFELHQLQPRWQYGRRARQAGAGNNTRTRVEPNAVLYRLGTELMDDSEGARNLYVAAHWWYSRRVARGKGVGCEYAVRSGMGRLAPIWRIVRPSLAGQAPCLQQDFKCSHRRSVLFGYAEWRLGR